MPSSVNLKALGLNFQPNQLEVEPGSLTTASNVIIRRSNVIEPRRGFKLYGTSFGTASDRLKQLFAYKKTILRHFSNTLQYDSDGLGTFSSFNETFTEAQTGLRTKSAEANGNLYLTSSGGIKKLSATSASDFTTASGFITNAGGVKATDINAALNVTLGDQAGFLSQDAAVAYKVLWLTKDLNNNLIQGTPSSSAFVYNYLSDLLLQDYINLAGALDNLNTTGSIIVYGQFIKNYGVTANTTSSTLQTQLQALGNQLDYSIEYASDAAASTNIPLQIQTVTLDNSLNLATITFSGTPTLSSYFSLQDDIYLTSTTSTPNNTPVDGFTLSNFTPRYTFTVTSANATVGAVYKDSVNGQLFTVVTTLVSGITLLTNGISAPGASGTLTKQSGTGDSTITYSAFTNVETFNSASGSDVSLNYNTISITNHGFISGQSVQLSVGDSNTVPVGLNVGTTYYIINPTSGTFQLSSTVGGPAIDITALGTNTTTSIFVIPTGNINGKQTITNIDQTNHQIQFSSKATGAVTVTNSKIVSYKFRDINATVGTGQTSSLNDLIVTIPTTHNQLTVIQDAISRYMTTLQELPIGVVSSALISTFLTPLEITTTANVNLDISIPQDAQNSNYFFQIYRSSQVVSTGATFPSIILVPDDSELQLVYEAYPTATEISNKSVKVTDVTPDSFRGANLYTNAFSGEGIAQANDIPPFALDINNFKGSTFFANTKTKQRQLLQLLGVSNMVIDFNNSITPKLMITDGTTTNVYKFQLGVQQVTKITTDTYANTADHSFIILYNANSLIKYFFRLNKTTPVGNPSGFVTGNTLVDIDISDLTTAAQIAQRLTDKINIHLEDFNASIISGPAVQVTNVDEGVTLSPSITGFSNAWAILVTTTGMGEDISTNTILLSSLTSPAQAVDETARSMVKVINRNSSETIYAYYTTGTASTPGQMLLEARNLNTNPFYLLTNNTNTGTSFSPDLSPVSSSTLTGLTNGLFTTSSNHNLTSLNVGNKILILELGGVTGLDWTGIQTITAVPDTTHFRVGTSTSSLTSGVFLLAKDAIYSSDEEKKNRIYFSKRDQPEAVPIVNFIDIGSLDKAILRIFPLRDSLFIFKEDGLYRISGEQIPFVTSLFDGSCVLVSSDSVALSNNVIYCWTSQGVSTVTEAGVRFNISRPIDTDILKKATNQYTNFKTATWGVGYESDNSYLLSTVVNTVDTEATITYRYSTLTNTWTTFDKTVTCGVVNVFGDDRLYLGAGDTNYTEQERKNYTRYDYADRQFDVTLASNSYFNNTLKLASVSNIDIGDVLVQEQYMTAFLFNALLQKIDSDPGVTNKNFYSTLKMNAGDNSHTSLLALATKLDTDLSSSVYVPLVGGSTDFVSIQGYYNLIITNMNSDPVLAFGNYSTITNSTIFESIVTNVNSPTNMFEVNLTLDYLQGTMTIYKSINTEIVYSPITMGDALSLKHFKESTVMFENKAFTNGTLSFSTDLLPAFIDITFNGDGNGIFGHSSFFGSGFFGGSGNSAPLRTYIPRDCQRCRYLVTKFQHNIARESFALYGITLTGDLTSGRAYR